MKSLENIWKKRGLFEAKEILLLIELNYDLNEDLRGQILDPLKILLLDTNKEFFFPSNKNLGNFFED